MCLVYIFIGICIYIYIYTYIYIYVYVHKAPHPHVLGLQPQTARPLEDAALVGSNLGCHIVCDVHSTALWDDPQGHSPEIAIDLGSLWVFKLGRVSGALP
jgi:hypothetical protein